MGKLHTSGKCWKLLCLLLCLASYILIMILQVRWHFEMKFRHNTLRRSTHLVICSQGFIWGHRWGWIERQVLTQRASTQFTRYDTHNIFTIASYRGCRQWCSHLHTAHKSQIQTSTTWAWGLATVYWSNGLLQSAHSTVGQR